MTYKNEERLLCATWFIALLFTIMQVILIVRFNHEIRRSSRVKVRTSKERRRGKKNEFFYEDDDD